MARGMSISSDKAGKGIVFSSWGNNLLKEKLNNTTGYILIGILAILVGLVSAYQITFTYLIVSGLIGLTVLVICLLNGEASIYINVVVAFYIYFFDRIISPGLIPIGIVIDVLILVSFVGIFVQRANFKELISQFLKSPIGIWVLILFFYLLFQLFNPYANSFIGWYQAFRKILGAILFFLLSFYAFKDTAVIRRYLKFIFWISLTVAFYGCLQQWLGFFSFDRQAAIASLEKVNLQNFNEVNFRKFSTFPDSSSFGICMAVCSVLFLIIGINEKRVMQRSIILFGVLIMLLGMGYSNVRTSNAMMVAGIFMYILITINKKNTRIFSLFVVFILGAIIYGPFYSNNTINRFRSTFNAKNDDSYLLRVRNRDFIQPYIYRHPIGGGLGTTAGIGQQNNPGHTLAGFMPDSGYLMKALETGFIGLAIVCFLYFTILKEAIIGYFKVRKTLLKVVYVAVAACLFAYFVGEYAQMALGQITDVVIYYPLIAIVMRLYKFENVKLEEDNQ